MRVLAGIVGALLLGGILRDAFETIVLPRRVTRHFRLTRLFYLATWWPWSKLAGRCPRKQRELFLAYFGPLSLIVLLGVWALGLITGFGLLQYAAGSQISAPEGASTSFWTDLYLSGTSFFTIGLGDVVPRTAVARALVASEGGVGFGFLAVVIGYLPVVYQAFSRREVSISLLDARAGSPPTAGELLRRHGRDGGREALQHLLADWERWGADLMESHLSYAVLCYFRSQHSNQSWLAALTAVLDTSALVIAGIEGIPKEQALLTFAIARHAVVDLAQIFVRQPRQPETDRLPAAELARLRTSLDVAGLHLSHTPEAELRLRELRRLYEPFVHSLGRFLLIEVPPWIPTGKLADNWQTTAWKSSASLPEAQAAVEFEHQDHF
ncbi:MAG TPA: potassium channel family protein [Terriglobales bacterium]|nr:potassium channel family protein [Terriglobales bacterium]